MDLYRPVGLDELRLVYQVEMRAFPPRLADQPIFYPVLNEPYARKIARDWNTRSETHAGFVTRFAVEDAYAARFARQVVGSREHEELWVPAEELDEFNAHLQGPIAVIDAFFGEGFTGDVPESGPLARLDARAQLRAIDGMTSEEVARAVEENHQAIFLGFAYWQRDAAGLSPAAHARVLDTVRAAWAAAGRAHCPL